MQTLLQLFAKLWMPNATLTPRESILLTALGLATLAFTLVRRKPVPTYVEPTDDSARFRQVGRVSW